MLSEYETKKLQAAERVAFYEAVCEHAVRRLQRARVEYRRLGGDASRPAPAHMAAMREWFGKTEFTKAAFVTLSDLVEIGAICGWSDARRERDAILLQLGFRHMSFYLRGKKTRGWVRCSQGVQPRHVEKFARYRFRRTDAGGVEIYVVPPPLPY